MPDPVFQSAERLARRLSVSRSELFTRAVAEYVHEHRYADVTAKLNRVYDQEDSRLDAAVCDAQAASLDDEAW